MFRKEASAAAAASFIQFTPHITFIQQTTSTTTTTQAAAE